MMGSVESFKDLMVWQKAMDLAAGSYRLARSLPRSEEYRLTSQLLRAAASVPADIAERAARGTRRKYAQHVSIAYGSLCETETHLILLVRAERAQAADTKSLLDLCREVGKMLVALRRRLRERPPQREATNNDH
jgi:four helix bundle protein